MTFDALTNGGHVLTRNVNSAGVTCLNDGCELDLNAYDLGQADFQELANDPCPGTEAGRRAIAEAEARASVQPPLITEPCIATPPDWEGTDAEAVGLAVAGAVADLQRQRDEAQAATDRSLDIISTLVAAMPETSWAGSNIAVEQALEWLEQHRPTPDPGP